MQDTIVTFTRKSVDQILKAGGSGNWKVNRKRARNVKFLVCTRNQENDGKCPEPHGSGFLIGKVKGFVASPDHADRCVVSIDSWAPLSIPELWSKNRNPVEYKSLDELKIDSTSIQFKAIPNGVLPTAEKQTKQSDLPFTIAEAKRRLAKTFKVGVDDIEITIRG